MVSNPHDAGRSRRAARTSQCILPIFCDLSKLLFYCSGIRAIVYHILLASIKHIPSLLSDFIFCAEILFHTSLFHCVTAITADSTTTKRQSLRRFSRDDARRIAIVRKSKLKSIVLASSPSSTFRLNQICI